MKLLIVTARYYPETFSITNIAEQLVKIGHDVTVLTGRPHYGLGKLYSGYEKYKKYELINGVKIIRVKETIRKDGTISLIKNYLSIRRLYKKELHSLKERFDIVISHVISPIFTMEGIKQYCQKYGVPHLHYGLDLWPESLIATGFLKRKSISFQLLKKYSRKMYNSCDFISFASPCTESYFHDYLKIDIPFKHIYQPCLTTPPDYELLDKHRFKNNNRLNILYCGTVAKFHHLDILIQALSEIKDVDNLLHVNIVGSGSELSNIKKITESLGLNNVVTFYGRVSKEETIQHYLNADVLFVPLFKNSYTSNMIPQKVIEYLMYGKPIIGMLFGDGRHLIQMASKHNVVCDTTKTALLESLEAISAYSDEMLETTGKENRLFFDNNKRFSLSQVCFEIIDLCDRLISNYSKKKGLKDV